MIKSPTFYCNESKQSHLHNRDYYLPLPQEMEVSFLFSLTFKLAIHSYTKVNTTLSPKTAASLRSTWSVSRAASLLHSALGDKALLQEGCCIRLYLKAKHKKHQDSFHLNPLVVFPLQSFEDYVFVRRAPSRPTCCTPFLGGKEREKILLGALCWPKIVFKLTHWKTRLWDRSPAHTYPSNTDQLQCHRCVV